MEFVKPILQESALTDGNRENYNLSQTLLKKDVRDTMAWVIVQFIRVLYPIAPFISKKLSGELGATEIVWPELDSIQLDFTDSINQVELLKEIVTSVRSIKQSFRMLANEKLNAVLEGNTVDIGSFTETYGKIVHKMAGISFVNSVDMSVPVVLNGGAILRMGIDREIDIQEKIANFKKEIADYTKMRDAALFRLNNEDFKNKATEEVIAEHNKRVEVLSEKINKIEHIIRSLEAAQ